jgi:hypothetical protein
MIEHSDMSDTVQLLKFVISIDDFNIGVELTCVWLVEVATIGALCLNITELCNNAINGASNLVGTNVGFVGIFNKEYPN